MTFRRLLLLLAALCSTPPNAAAQVGQTLGLGVDWSDVDVPGTPHSFASAAGLSGHTVGAEWLILQCARVSTLQPSTCGAQTNRVQTYLTALHRFRNALEAIAPDKLGNSGGIRIDLKAAGSDKKRFRVLAEAIGLTVATRKGTIRVALGTESSAIEIRRILLDAGIDIEGADDRLNAGQAIRLSVPRFKAALPLSQQWWREVVFKENVPPSDFAEALIGDRDALLLYYGLASLDAVTRAYVASKPSMVSVLYRDHPGAFATYAGNIRVRNGRIDVPGGEKAAHFWEVLVGERTDKPDAFIRALLSADSGRRGYFYHVIDSLDPPHVRFALGLYEGATLQLARELIDPLYGWFNVPDPYWDVDRRPFSRPATDPSLVLAEVAVGNDGRPIGPDWRYLWNAVVADRSIPDRPEKQLKRRPDRVDAPFWIDWILRVSDISSSDKLRTLLFAQRVFPAASEDTAPDLLVTLRGFPRFQMLHLTLERIGIRAPAVYAAASRRAASLSGIRDRDVAAMSLSQFQGAMTLIGRATLTGRISSDIAQTLVTSLLAVEFDRDGSYGLGVALWLDRQFVPAVAATSRDNDSHALEPLVLAGLAGMNELSEESNSRGRLVEWEGWQYRIDLSRAFWKRTLRVRQRQDGNSLDTILALARLVSTLDRVRTPADAETVLVALTSLQKELKEPRPPPRLSNEKPVTVRQTMSDALGVLTRKRSKNVERLQKAVASTKILLAWLTAVLTADLLRQTAYATQIVDSETPLLAGGDVSYRHDFGLAADSSEEREHAAWSLPKPPSDDIIGMPKRDASVGFRVTGALLGLDIALAELPLKRANAGPPPEMSSWSPGNRKAYLQVLALFNPFDLRLAQVHVVNAAIKNGRERVAKVVTSRSDLDTIAKDAGVSALRRSLLLWAVERQPTTVPNDLSLTELLRIGGDDEARRVAAAWGGTAIPTTGCLCLSVEPSVAWDAFSGSQTDSGLLAAHSPDLLLRLAEAIDDLRLPPELVSEIVPFAVQAVLDESRLDYLDDWLAVMRYATSISQRTIEEYISRATNGQSMVPIAAVGR